MYSEYVKLNEMLTCIMGTWALLRVKRVVTKISSCRVNTTSRRKESNSWGFLLVLFFFYFPIKVARGYVQGTPRPILSPCFLMTVLGKHLFWFNSWVNVQPSIHCLNFIYAGSFYAHTHVKITWQWKPTAL